MLDKNCGAASLCSAAQRWSDVQVVTGAGAGFGIAICGRFELMTSGGFVLGSCGGLGRGAASGSTQFKADAPWDGAGDEMVSSGIVGVEAQPARKISAPRKRIPAGLNTRQLCGTPMRTQDDFFIYDLRYSIYARMA